MKLSPQQDINLREYIRDVVRYRETYEEVYDHVMSALEQHNYRCTAEEAINQILREDFGGYENLRYMEIEAKATVVANSVGKFVGFMLSYFKWPRLLYTLALGALIYFTLGQVRLQPLMFEGIFALVILTPGILSMRRYYLVGYLFRDTKRSIRDDIFARISMVPTRLFVFLGLGIVISIDKYHNIWNNATPSVLTALYLLSGIYLLAIVQLYRDEFKMRISA